MRSVGKRGKGRKIEVAGAGKVVGEGQVFGRRAWRVLTMLTEKELKLGSCLSHIATALAVGSSQ